MEQLRAYKYRIYPTEEQKVFFAKTFGCVRLVYNLMLSERIKDYEMAKKDLSKKKKFPTPAKYKKDFPFLKEVDSLALANAQLNLDKAYKNFFRDKSVGFPRFKSKKNPVQSYTTNNQKGTIALLEGKFIKIPKLKSLIRIKLHRQPKGVIKSATISLHSSGKYFISLLCKEEIDELPRANASVGIALGVNDFVILSSGKKIDNHTFTPEIEKKLKREQRKLVRRMTAAKEKGKKLSEAKNYQKQKRRVARLQEKRSNQRNDFLDKLSTEIIKNHDVICIEDLKNTEMLRNYKLSKRISDVSWSSFLIKLHYKAKWHRREIIKVDHSFLQNQICPDDQDREVQASKNILKKGLCLTSIR
jgi:putative transposase